MAIKNFTFKKHPKETGLAAVGHPHPWVDIRLAGKVVGSIVPPSAFTKDNRFRVMLHVVSDDPCGWRNITLKFSGETEQAVRDFLKENCESIQSRYALEKTSPFTAGVPSS